MPPSVGVAVELVPPLAIGKVPVTAEVRLIWDQVELPEPSVVKA